MPTVNSGLVAIGVACFLTGFWQPLGYEKSAIRNFVFVAVLIGGIMVAFRVFQHYYDRILGWCLDHKTAFLSIPVGLLILGGLVWQGYDTVVRVAAQTVYGFGPGTSSRQAVSRHGQRIYASAG